MAIMKPPMTARAAVFTLLVNLLTATIAFGGDKTAPTYQQGTIAKSDPGPHKSYDLKGTDTLYHIKNCGDFQTGQAVDYRVEGFTIYIRREGGKEYKCRVGSIDSAAPATPPPPKYQQGTIMGYDIRRDTRVSGGGGPPGMGGAPVSSSTRNAKVYQLKAGNLLYKMDYCGAFQAGQFQVGQTVDFRVDDERLYVRHDGDKEFNCKLEGVSAIEDPKPNAAPSTDASAPH
ncbi:MAG: hypothetical protein ACLPHP_21700 [Candidatus Sulfotelmatobacter sp.]